MPGCLERRLAAGEAQLARPAPGSAGEREWRSMGARTASEAASIITAQMLRSLSVRVHSGHMRVLYARLRYVGMSAAQAATHAGGGEASGGVTGGG